MAISKFTKIATVTVLGSLGISGVAVTSFAGEMPLFAGASDASEQVVETSVPNTDQVTLESDTPEGIATVSAASDASPVSAASEASPVSAASDASPASAASDASPASAASDASPASAASEASPASAASGASPVSAGSAASASSSD